jgi:hypothetical protein
MPGSPFLLSVGGKASRHYSLCKITLRKVVFEIILYLPILTLAATLLLSVMHGGFPWGLSLVPAGDTEGH